MPNYRRAWQPGGTYFFTVALLLRQGNDLLTQHVDLLRECVRSVRERHPFKIHAWVVLPDHLHCVIELPPGDADFATRWRLIKMGFSKALPHGEARSAVRVRRGGFSRAHGLRAYQSGEAWIGRAGRRLAVLDLSFARGGRGLCAGLGWVMSLGGRWLVDRRNALRLLRPTKYATAVGRNNRRALRQSLFP